MTNSAVSVDPTLKPNKIFANYFWGPNDEGFTALTSRFSEAKQINEELRLYFRERASIEEEYARKLSKLTKMNLGSNETGSLRDAMFQLKEETGAMSKLHFDLASYMQDDLEGAISRFASNLKEKKRNIIGMIDKSHKVKVAQTQAVIKAQERYEYYCKRINYYVSQQNLLVGKDLEKNNNKLSKTQQLVTTSARDYKAAVEGLKDINRSWIEEWHETCDKMQDIEENRRDYLKSLLWKYCSIVSKGFSTGEESAERLRQRIECCNVLNDIECFIDERGTGSGIPQALKFYDYYKGEAPDGNVEVVQAAFTRETSNVVNDKVPLNRQYTLSNPTTPNFSNTVNTGSPLSDASNSDVVKSRPVSKSPTKRFFDRFAHPSRSTNRSTTSLGITKPQGLSVKESLSAAAIEQSMSNLKMDNTPRVSGRSTVNSLHSAPSNSQSPSRSPTRSSVNTNGRNTVQSDTRPDRAHSSSSARVQTAQSYINRKQQLQEEFGSVLEMENRAASPMYYNSQGMPEYRSSTSQRNSVLNTEQHSRTTSSVSAHEDIPRSLTPGLVEPRYDFGIKVSAAHSPVHNYYDDDDNDDTPAYQDQAMNVFPKYNEETNKTPNHTEQVPAPKYERFDGTAKTTDGLPIIGYVHALYSYTAAIPEEISFQKGDTLAVLKVYDDGWWEGFVVGEDDHNRGQFPSNFVKEVNV
ncbi:contractile ring protein Imp2 [Schizosaccharomyces japonicus yFS275]|uniref:Contractile ring protein Imp2 n=1 Tax=Schizosaccharomyces japonicus (strain yFS275 / FY16936) TaxID=402676 RepID=B6K5V1_SCHJY|nr:contractile ring protein Imp2 [Schizosaccharomyces japonicus yFS275]EEB08905.2 contractile ring protein Imp2 [Schizosaccharomyces japonicus yFS275]